MEKKIKNEEVFIVYHRVDYDGVFSGCIARDYVEHEYYEQCNTPTMIGWNYGDAIPAELMNTADSTIIMVDISFAPETMLELIKKNQVIYIDHHQTALSAATEFGYDNIDGKREIGRGAVELTWEYFYPTEKCPRIIQYISANDVWDKNRFLWSDVSALQLILREQYGMSFNAIYEDWWELTNMSFEKFIEFLNKGRLLLNFQTRQFESAVKAHAFEIKVAGRAKGVCMLTHAFGSRIFESVADEYQVYVTVNIRRRLNGEEYFSIGMYTNEGSIDFSLGEYLKTRFGGGGHACAAGAEISADDFMKLILDHEI